MCGITGYWFRNALPEAAPQWLRESVASLQHRGPDDRGVWTEGGVGLGHARLSILDLSPLGRQPMTSRDGRWVMVFNGEIYNFREIRKELEARGHAFSGTGDSEVILEAFAAWGVEAVDRFLGMFAIALWSAADRRLYLLRDRLGVKPLYYGWDGASLWFGSELRALRAFKHWTPELDPAAIADFLRFGYIAEPRSIYRQVSKLPAGHWLELGPEGSTKIVRYWSVLDRFPGHRSAGEEELAEELEALMVEAFRYRMIADVPVGVFLSGGIDSSVLAAILQRHGGQRIRTFTIGFDESDFDESPYARRVARYLGTEHVSRVLGVSEAKRMLRAWGTLFDEPFGDSSAIPTLLVSRVAAESVKVVLSADGGDELFSGYNAYTGMLARRRKLAAIPEWLRSSAVVALQALTARGSGPDGALALDYRLEHRAIAPFARVCHRLQTRSLGEMYEDALTVWGSGGLRQLLGSHPHPTRASCDIYPGGDGEKLCLWDLHHYLPGDILTKVDRATMAASIEGREPLLDHRLVEFAFSLPFHLRRGSAGPKHLLRKVLYRYVPRHYLDRPKQGFSIPMQQWLREMQQLIDDYVDPGVIAAQGLFDPGVVRRVLARFRAGDCHAWKQVWLLLAFQMWHARWMSN